jgi:hypothetical protein
MIKLTDQERLKSHALSSSKWITVEEFYQQVPEARGAILIEEWKQESKIFSLVHEGVELIPEYILGLDGNPKPVVQGVLRLFDGKKSSLAIAIWFMSVNSWLRGKTPIDCLDTSQENVLEAARMEAFPSDHG